MTENEAKKWINTLKNWNSILPEAQEACEIAEKQFEEIQQYRAIGTVEEFKALKENKKNVYKQTIDDMTDNLIRNSRTEVIDGKISLVATAERIKIIAEEMINKILT